MISTFHKSGRPVFRFDWSNASRTGKLKQSGNTGEIKTAGAKATAAFPRETPAVSI